jgi:2-polyprenyl-3-methyl-5-hydroxy-6-metoxy-1,4-benzoquinol methylase
MMKNPSYSFAYLTHCQMCGEGADNHKILGHRLNISQGFSPRAKKGITTTVLKCNRCRTIYSNPQPIPISIQDHYGVPPEDYWKPDYFKTDPQYFLHEIGTLTRLMTFRKGMRALDIGAGLGKCMIALESFGFETYGLEPSGSFYAKAIERMKINPERMKLGMIEDAQYPESFFDFITFGAVLEHLYDPACSIDKAMKWLKPGGMLHLEVPSANYLISRMINFYYMMIGTSYVTNTSPMHGPYHLFEFTLGSFEKLQQRSKSFEIIFHEYFVCSAEPFPKFTHRGLAALMKVSKTGMQLSIWLKKT